MTFGSRLSEARRGKQLTQEQLGKGLGTDGKDVTKAVVSGWEKDYHSPRADQLAMICERLDCSADYLLLGRIGVAAPSEFTALAQEADQLPPRQRDWVLMTLREAVKLARETVSDSAVTTKDTHEQGNKTKRQTAG